MKTTDNSKWFIKIGQPETLARLEKTEGAIKVFACQTDLLSGVIEHVTSTQPIECLSLWQIQS
jgi:hypothetical protein